MEEEWNPIELKNWCSGTISGCLEARVGGKQLQLGTFAPIRDKVFYQGKKMVIHWGLFPVVGKIQPWVIVTDVMLASGYVRRNLLNKEMFHLWECTSYLWMHMNKKKWDKNGENCQRHPLPGYCR